VPVFVLLGGLVLLGLLFGPLWWVQRTLRHHGADRPDLPGTGAELARLLLDAGGLGHVAVELTDAGDHYDPDGPAVRLLPQHHDGRSVAAAAVAAHEVAHALQHARGERAFTARLALVRKLSVVERVASAILFLAPVVFALVHAPVLFVVQIAVGILLLASRILVHAVTLPVELDASFGKALPVLEQGRYLAGPDLASARSVLNAAAWTYVAAALATLLDVVRWFRLLRI
jgi:Zn-dependent membrane protease YugP